MKQYKWVPLFGEIEVKRDSLRFQGKLVEPAADSSSTEAAQPPTSVPTVGLVLCDHYLTDGSVSTTVEFEEVGPSTGCEIVVDYDVDTKGFVSAGVTGFEFGMFSIREWYPGAGGTQGQADQPRWIPYSIAGDRANLRAHQKYELKATLYGSRLTLEVDGVAVAVATLRATRTGRHQIGLWFLSHSSITVRDFKVDSEKPRAFVVMQFSAPYDDVYSEVIKSVSDRFTLETIRADELYGPGLIVGDVIDQIARAQLIIADIAPVNANVYFEVGYALALSKPMILLAKKGTQLPFDVSGFRVLFYEDSIAGKARIEEGLTRHIRAILGPS